LPPGAFWWTGSFAGARTRLHTRWEIEPFLRAGVLDYVQADPDWTGG
jgi:L-alanine-DL-glutamate epimerase-like enolase superfamily enzyme